MQTQEASSSDVIFRVFFTLESFATKLRYQDFRDVEHLKYRPVTLLGPLKPVCRNIASD